MKTYDKSSLDKNENLDISSDSSYFFRKLWNNEARVVQWLERRLYTAQVGGSKKSTNRKERNIPLHEYISFCPKHTIEDNTRIFFFFSLHAKYLIQKKDNLDFGSGKNPPWQKTK